jgi:hypothetical protein
MKYLASSLIALGFAATAVQGQAQDASAPPPDNGAAAPAQPDTAAPPPTPAPATDAQPATDTAPAPAPGATAPPAAAPSANAPQAATVTVSDSEVDQFARATVKVQKINGDASLDANAKQTQMAAAVKAAGLDPARYNQIAQALPNDSALMTKVKTAMSKYAAPKQG